ncbi:class I SAM-dependent methyltransferase [Desulfobotulus mexicanus]|uniref:Methyltransferase domain-containing protein n=1 Tax=Desulfobotulus mexicanus TaxID=2586642 RepID=A0A5Q4VB60_9BACT|nr:class I SAM-dependent methyltransferase [Desulfobotulus mexicanus]TYT74949.1 methyltransferase domain-containing protein [Desulfobotulus mexicanus]
MITVDFRRMTIRPGWKILDIGSGPGRHTAAAYGLEKVTAIGADLCHRDLLSARERLENHDMMGWHGGGSWGLSTADITRLPFRNQAFDAVICSEVMEHIPNDKAAAAELVRVARPGADVVVSVPRFWPEKICWWLAKDYSHANQGHVRIYKKNELIRMLEAEGLEYRGCGYAHGLHSPFWWLKCLVGPTNNQHPAVRLYHRFLVWDIMEKPALTRIMDRILNPFMGKSLVLYFRKP